MSRRLGWAPSTIMRDDRPVCVLATGGIGRGIGSAPSGEVVGIVARATAPPGPRPALNSARARPKPGRLAVSERLHDQVQYSICTDNYSPEQIARRLRLDFPDQMRRCGCPTNPSTSRSTCKVAVNFAVSCTSVCAPAAPCANRNAAPMRAAHASATWSTSASVHPKSPTVLARALGGRSDLGRTRQVLNRHLVEPATRVVLLLHLPDDHGALAVQEAMVAKMRAAAGDAA